MEQIFPVRNFQKFVNIARWVILFSGNCGKCCSIRSWKILGLLPTNSLIMTVKVFGYLILINFFWDDISNTQDSVSSHFQSPRISSKILHCALYFQLSSRCLDIPMKHCLSCLIYYLYNAVIPQSLDRTIVARDQRSWSLNSFK